MTDPWAWMRRALVWVVVCSRSLVAQTEEVDAPIPESWAAVHAAASELDREGHDDGLLALVARARAALDASSSRERQWRAYTRSLAAEAALASGRWSAFETHLLAVDQYVDTADDGGLRAHALGLRGQAALRRGHLQEAATLLEQEWAVAREQHARGAYGAETTLRNAHLDIVKLRLAQTRHEDVVRLVDEVFLPSGVYEVDPPGARAASLLYNRGVAERHLDSARDGGEGGPTEGRARATFAIVEPLPYAIADRARVELAALDLSQGAPDEARRRLMAVPPEGRDDRWHVLRARLGRLSGEPAEAMLALLDASWRSMDATWRREGAPDGGVSRLHFLEDRSLVAEVLLAEVRAHGAEAALVRWAALQAVSTLGQRLAVDGDLGVARLRAALEGERHGLLVFGPIVSGGSIVFAVDRDEVVVGDLPDYYALDRLRRRWWRGLTALTARSEEERHASQLADLLLPDAVQAAALEWTSLTVVGLDGWPVAWLRTGGERWGVRWALDRWPSIPVGVALVERARAARGDRADGAPGEAPWAPALLVVADRPSPEVTRTHPEVVALPGAASFVGEVVAAAGAGRLDVLTGRQATWEQVVDASARRTRVLHLHGHAVYESDVVEPAALVLAPDAGRADGLVRCVDVREDMSGRAPSAVVLMACRSGAGPDRRGDPSSGDLAGAWVTAGADVVVVTHDVLTDTTARVVGADLLQALLDGHSPADALRTLRAQRVAGGVVAADGLVEIVGAGQMPVLSASEVSMGRANGVASPGPQDEGDEPGHGGAVALVAAAAVSLALACAVHVRRRAAS